MKCPFCGHVKDRVVDSRETKDGDQVRRRRLCLGCDRRFTTYERIEPIEFMVIKKGGQREPFDRQKLMNGLLSSCQKRPVRLEQCESIVNDVLSILYQKQGREIETQEIGEIVMDRLKQVDEIAYIRFASVYREFKEAKDFVREVKSVQET